MIKSSSSTKNGFWSKLIRLSLGKKGRHGKEEMGSLKDKSSNVNEEYKEAFRTNSYIEICNKVQGKLETRTSSSSCSSSSSRIDQVPLSEYLLEPRQETLDSIFGASNNHFLANYFNISVEAGEICESLLQNVHQARINYRTVKEAVDLINIGAHTEYHASHKDISTFALHKNPFSSMNRDKFVELHNSHAHLLHQLTSQYRKTKRKTKFFRSIKRALITGLIVGSSGLAVALLVLSLHTMVGLVAAPGLLILCSLVIFLMKKSKRNKIKSRKNKRVDQDRGLGSQLDVAARGVYILINDFDTMSRLVQRLYDEVEHTRFLSEICVRKGKKNREMLKEVVREFRMHEGLFLEEMEELEKQVCLCFLDINRSRRLLVQEMDKY
ncbi:hypothetical protein ABFS82_03G073900 [Erythranthe guttata]